MSVKVVSEKLRRSNRRIAVLLGIVFGTLWYIVLHSFQQRFSQENAGYDSTFLGISTIMPRYLGFVWPLDLLEDIVAMTVFAYLASQLVNVFYKENAGAWHYVKSIAGVFCGCGCLGAIFGTALAGWFYGLQMFFVIGGIITVALLAFVICGVIWYNICVGVALACIWLWRLIRYTALGRKLQLVSNYFKGET